MINGRTIETKLTTDLSLMDSLTGHRSRKGPEEVHQVILHHDAALSALSCHRALKGRKLSTHFCVDNDGTVFQFLDPALTWAYHCMGSIKNVVTKKRTRMAFNKYSIGIDISNAVLLKYADRYRPERLQETLEIQGRKVTGMLPYGVQVQATLVLLLVLIEGFGIEVVTRTEASWEGDLRPDTPGIYGHFHVNPGKIDPFGFPFTLVEKLT